MIEPTAELEALSRNVQRTFSEIVEQIPYLPEELQMAIANIDDPAALAHLIAGALRIGTEEKQKLLEEVDVAKRLRHLSRILARELEVVQLGTQIQTQVQSEIDKGQREFFLRQQLKAIQDELGEEDEQQAEANELREKIEAAELPEHALKAAERELSRLEKLPPAAAEHGVIRTYLEWLTELPWSKETEDNLDIGHARKVLDADHYDLEKIKDRILEYLAVRKLNPDSPGPILCFVGPPGVGKTSLGKSIAKALGREFERISVGGVRDEAEIRGHRRTYIGAMPGTIVRALRDAGSRNPVFMIDEIDKMGADFRGDPASAMLEVLDPAQNDSFRDHYLDLEFDLSDVVFIATANVLDTIPGPLLDRMETIELAGYTLEEKRQIARRYLVRRQIEANGLKPSQIEFADAALTAIIEEYTREAGVRNLERQIGTVCRKVARDVAEGKAKGKVRVSGRKARELLGRRRVFAEQRRRTKDPGVATGLAWTPTGGDVLFIEATAMPGSGKLTITGQLGDVMKESAQAALSYVRGHYREIAPKLEDDWFAEHDIHIHVPAGAVPKDGPSAGVAMTVALSSLISGRPVRNDVAMTGEVTLTGQVLPIGGLKEKSLAAQRAGIKKVIVPEPQRGRRRRDPRARARQPRVRLRRRGLPGPRSRPPLVRSRSRAFWIVAGLTALGAVLRFATLGVQAYHHDEIVTASRVLRVGFGHAMDAVGFSRVGAAALLRAGLALDPGDRQRRVGAALALGGRRGRDDPGRLLHRPRTARRARRRHRGGAGRRQPDAALVLAGGAGLRAARALLRALAALLRAGAAGGPQRGGQARLRPLGRLLGAGAGDALLRRLPAPRRDRPAGAPARAGRDPLRALDRRRRRGAAGAAGDPPDVLRPRRMDRQIHPRPPARRSRDHLHGRRDRRHHRPRRAVAGRRCCRWRWSLAAFALVCWRADSRSERRAAASRSRSARPRSASRCCWRSSPPARTSSSPATCCRRWSRSWSRSRSRLSGRAGPSPRHRDRRAPGRLLPRLLRLGQHLAGAAAAGLARRSPTTSASPTGRGRRSPGCSARRRCATTSRPGRSS